MVSAVEDFDEVVEQYHLAIGEFMKGNPEPAKEMFSHRDDVTLANPPWRGRARMGAGCPGDGACRIVSPRWRDRWLRDR